MSDESDTTPDGVQPSPREEQLRLFPWDRPLVRRFGVGFFRAVPELPGVYLMRDQERRLLYVGKARNLRRRLGSYRCLQGASRKTIRMVYQVASIEWEPCRSEQEALLRENELLRTERPRFNRVGTWPQAYQFVHLWRCPDGFGLQLENGSAGEPDAFPVREGWFNDALRPVAQNGSLFGAFKSAHRAIPSLLRLVWVAMSGGFDSLPRSLCLPRGPRRFELQGAGAAEWRDGVQNFLAGTSGDLLERLASLPVRAMSAFDGARWAADLEAASDFFQRGPRRNEELRRRAGRVRALFCPEDLDDLVVIHRPLM